MDQLALGTLLREVTRLHAQLQREQVACGGTTVTQCSILTELGRHGAMTLADLGRRLGLDKGWLSRTVEALAQAGLLTKVPGENDRRTVLIALSPAGQVRYQKLSQMLNDLSERVIDRIELADRATIQRALELLQQALIVERAATPAPLPLEKETDT
ncbi:MAG TPA: MarR family transcriptional regulator [Aggregatilineaceae bacterium]|nr:MarR family transcriptional regulator [Aggregatilineaceae bacterium]